MSSALSYRAVLLDIEGTTTPISFVHDTLFPYARRELEAFVTTHWSELSDVVSSLRQQAEHDRRAGEDAPIIPASDDAAVRRAVCANVEWQMDRERKTTGLKSLQGRIWRAGYDNGELVATMFPDVLPALRAWHERDIPVYIYSSGSIAAQNLLFGHTAQGDVRDLLAGYFDTTTGGKKEAASYERIAAELALPCGDITFVTDSLDEALAAHEAGVNAIIASRPGNSPLPEHDFPVVNSLSALLP